MNLALGAGEMTLGKIREVFPSVATETVGWVRFHATGNIGWNHPRSRTVWSPSVSSADVMPHTS